MAFQGAFNEEEEPMVSLACEADEHYECDGEVLGRPVGGGVRTYLGQCKCYCHKKEPESEQ